MEADYVSKKNKQFFFNDSRKIKNTRENKCISKSGIKVRWKLLNPGGVKHDANALPNGFGGQILGEFGTNSTTAAMGACHLAPNHLVKKH